MTHGLIVNGQLLVRQNNAQITSQRTNALASVHGKGLNAKKLLKLVQICQLKKVVQTWLDVDGNQMLALASQYAKTSSSAKQKGAMYLLEARERNANQLQLCQQVYPENIWLPPQQQQEFNVSTKFMSTALSSQHKQLAKVMPLPHPHVNGRVMENAMPSNSNLVQMLLDFPHNVIPNSAS